MESGYPVHFCPFHTFPPKQNLEKHTSWKRDGNLEVSWPPALLQAVANQGQVITGSSLRSFVPKANH